MRLDDPEAPDGRGLLDTIADTALDDDYYVTRSGHAEPTREFSTMITAVVLLVFALLVTIAAVQTRTDRPATELERQTLAEDVEARQAVQDDREATARDLRAEVEDLRAAAVGYDPAYESLRVLTADRAATGPGVRVTVNDAPPGGTGAQVSVRDLRTLVNGLWYAGAEAIAINGNRLGSLSSISLAAGSIKVGYRSVEPPYAVTALGDRDRLGERLDANFAGEYWQARRSVAGLRYSVAGSSDLSVPAAPSDRLAVLHATTEGAR